MVLPVAALTFRALGDKLFAKGYQSKNIMRQMMASFASAVAAVALQDSQFTEYTELMGRVTPGNQAAVDWLARLQASFEGLGYTASQAHGAALAELGNVVHHQAFFMACQNLYQWLALVAALAAVVVSVQRHLK